MAIANVTPAAANSTNAYLGPSAQSVAVAHNGQYSNITESNPTQTVHAYSSGTYDVVNQKINQTSGDSVYAEIYGFAANPLYNNDPSFDYYIFDVYVAATSSTSNGWYVDSAGLGSSNGPTFNFTIYVCNSPGEVVLLQNISPPSEVDTPGNSPQTTSVDLSYAGFSIGVSRTFTPPTSQTKPVAQTQCSVGWASASYYNDNPPQSSYSYNFAFGLKVQKGQPAILQTTVEGSFYKPYGCGLLNLGHCDYVDHPSLTFTDSFSPPPVTTITSSPAVGDNFVQVDNTPIRTPAQFVWDEGNSHSLGASTSPVAGGVGTRYIFSSWNGGQSPTQNINAPTVPTTFVANFQTQYEMNVSVAQPSLGTTSNPTPGSWWYNGSKSISVLASPTSGYALSTWTLDGVNQGSGNPINVVMNGPHILVASFSKEPSLTVNAGPGGSVTVVSSAILAGVAQMISAGSSNTYTVPAGTSVTLTANPQTSYFFGNWTGAQYSTANPIAIVVNSDMQETANFALPYAAVTFTVGGLGSTASGGILTVDGSTYGPSSLPVTLKMLVGSSHTFAWTGNVTGGQGVRFVWRSTSGFTTAQSGTLTVPQGGGTITGNWATQYLITFQTIGLDYSALGTVLNVQSSHIAYSQMPYSIWVDASTSLNFNFTTTVASSVQSVQFPFVSYSSPSPLFVTGPLTVSASYGRETVTSSTTSASASTTSTSILPAPIPASTSTAQSSSTSSSVTSTTPTVSTVTVSQTNTGINSETLSVGLAAGIASMAVIAVIIVRRR